MFSRTVTGEPWASYVVPIVLIVAVTLSLMEIPDYFQLLLPVLAFGCGFIFRPRRSWAVWLASLVIYLACLLGLLLSGYVPPKATDQAGVTLGGFIADVGLYALYLAVLAWAPLRLGRFIRDRRERQPRPRLR